MASSNSTKLRINVTPVDALVSEVDSTKAYCNLFEGSGHSHREYLIQIWEESANDNDDPVCTTQMRFSVFRKHFDSDQMQSRTRHATSIFPPRGMLWEDYTNSVDKVRQRADSMEAFLTNALNSNGPAVLRSDCLRAALQLSPEAANRLVNVASRRQKEEERQHNIRVAAQKEVARKQQEARQQAIQAENARRNRAQTLNVTNVDTRHSLKFQDVKTEFQLYQNFFSFAGNENIRGGHNKPWFRLVRTDYPQILPFSDLSYQLITMHGVPLLEMKERFAAFHYQCDLYYVTSKGQRIPAVTVERHFQFGFSETFDVRGKGSLAKRQFSCQGPWLQESIRINGKRAAQLHQHFISFNDGYTLTIEPNQDCLIILGIACAVIRIHAARRN